MATSFDQQSAVRVLIVEDNDAQRRILSDLIRDEGFDPVACRNAAEALTQADVGPFGVAILDQRLPEMSGTELLGRLRTMQRGLRAIIHTAYGSFESAKDAVNLGAFAYVEKLGHPEELVRHVHRAAQVWMTEALQRSEAKYRQLVDSVHAIVWRSDPVTGRFRFVSQEAETMLGYPVRQWLTDATFWQDRIHPEDRDWVLERCARATTKRQSQEFEYRMMAADGRIVWLRDFVNIIVEAGQPSELVGVMIDITEQKHTAEALRRSQERLNEAQHIAHIGNWELDLETDTLTWSDEMFRIHGLDPVAFEGDVQAFVSTAVHPEDQASVQAVLQQALRECGSFTSDYRLLQPGGSQRFVSAQGHVLCEEGRPTRMVGVVQDITERRRAEEEARQRSAVLKLSQEIAQLGSWEWDVVQNKIFWSDELYRIFGLEPGSAVDWEMVQSTLIHPDDGPLLAERLKASLVDPDAAALLPPIEYRIIRPDGTTRTVWGNNVVFFDKHEKPIRMVCAVQDITERKQAAKALEENEKRYRILTEHAAEAIVVLDFENGRFVDSNSNAEALYGLPRQELHQTGPVAMSPEYQPDGRLSAEVAHAEIMKAVEGEVRVFEWIHRNAEGYDVPCEVRLVRLPSAEGRVLVRGSVTDITERKKAEEALRKSEQSFRLMFTHSPLPMWVYDRQTYAFLDVNEAALEKYGYSRDEFLSIKIDDIRPAEDIPRFREYIAALSGTVQQVTQWKHKKKDGTVLDVEVTAHDFPYRERPGRLVLANDITERKRLEKEILEISNREQRRIGQDLHDRLGQLLTGIGFRIAELEGDLQEDALPAAADAAEIGRMVERAIAQTRALAHGLDPVNVEQQGLAVALRELTHSIETIYGVTCVFDSPEPVQVRDPAVAIHVYRIVQESITNALKHAQATRVDVTLTRKNGMVVLTVSDDGVGLPANNAGPEGMGLRIMDYRARMISGTFDLGSGPAGGTVVTCSFPHTSVQQPAE